jgi:hypothetical protein
MDPDSKPKGPKDKKGWEPDKDTWQVGDCWKQWELGEHKSATRRRGPRRGEELRRWERLDRE